LSNTDTGTTAFMISCVFMGRIKACGLLSV